MITVPLQWYLILAAALFCIGVYGILASKNLIVTVMSIELMLNAVVLNLVSFARFVEPARIAGKTFAIVIYAAAAAEAAVGLALAISIWRAENTVDVDQIKVLKG